MRRRAVLVGALTALALASAAMALVVVRVSDLGPRGLVAEPAPGALVEGVEVVVEGGSVRSVDGRHVTVRLTRPAARVRLASRAEGPVAVHLDLVNAWRQRGKLALRIQRGGRSRTKRARGPLEIRVAPNEVVEVCVGGPPTEGAEFEFVVIEGGKEGLAELHAMLRGLGADPPAFIVYRDRERCRGGLRELGPFVEIIEASYVPVYVVAAAARPGGQPSTFGRLLGPHRIAFAHGGCRFIFLGATGERVSASDRAWLARQLAGAGGGERTFVLAPCSRDARGELMSLLGRYPAARVCFADERSFSGVGGEGRAEPGHRARAWRVRVRSEDGRNGRNGHARRAEEREGARVVRRWEVGSAWGVARWAHRGALVWLCASRRLWWVAFGGAVLAGGWALVGAWVVWRVVRRVWRRVAGAEGRGVVAGVVVVAAVLWLYISGLGALHIRSSNEANRVQATFEMLETGDFVVPHLNGKVYLYKPPLYYWVNSLAWLPGGPFTEFRARISAVAAAMLCLAAVYGFARRWFGAREALAGAVILAASPLFLVQAREAELDMLLCALTTLSLCLLLAALEARRRRLALFAASFAALAAAAMTKGPVPLAIVVLTAGCFLGWTFRKRWRCWRGLALGTLVLVGLVTPWCVLVVRRIGWDAAWATLMSQSVRRVREASEINVGPWYFYLRRLAATFFPWSLWIPAAVAFGWRRSRAWRGEREARAVLFLAMWVVPSFIFFSACAGKEAQYILPLYPPLAMLCGLAVVRWQDGELRRGEGAMVRWGGYVGGAVLAAGGIVAMGVTGSGLAARTLAGAFPAVVVVGAVLVVAGVGAVVCSRRRAAAGTLAFLFVALAAAKAFDVGERAPEENAGHSPRAFCRRARALVPADAPLILYKLNRPVYSVYMERVGRYVREPEECDLAELDERQRKERLAQHAAVLEAMRSQEAPAYVLATAKTYRALVDQLGAFGRCELAAHAGDPVVLIANRAALASQRRAAHSENPP